jgi:signal transduction histidine kinase
MGSRGTHLRTKIVALLVSLTALWAFAAWVTLREGVNLLWVQTYDSKIYQPTEPLLLDLQVERRLSVGYLGTASGTRPAELDERRGKIDEAAAKYRESIRGDLVRVAADDELEARADTLAKQLDGLPALRSSIDKRQLDRTAAATAFTSLISSIFDVYHALGKLDDQEIAENTAALIDLTQAEELTTQEDALITGVLAAGKFTEAEYNQFVGLVSTRRYLAAKAAGQIAGPDRDRYHAMDTGATATRFREIEDQEIARARGSLRIQVTAADWRATADGAESGLLDIILVGGDSLVDRATPIAVGVLVRLLLAAGLGLFAVIASIVVAINTTRALMRQLQRLREAAWQLSHERLPGVVERLSRGESVDVSAEAPPLEFGSDEIGQVGQAFNAVQETALRVAVEQAELRQGVRDVFLNLARRSQALVHRQLTLLDTMERRQSDAAELEDLFRLDHLATRMRRHSENLIVLSGATPGRAWRRGVPMVDVIRGAIGEVEDYTRVTVLPPGDVGLAGRAVGDVIHLLAELMENALSFSPPNTEVRVKGHLVGNGYAVEIEDHGLGMTRDELAEANERVMTRPLERPGDPNLRSLRLGLYVVSRLAERHHMRVSLQESPFGGTTAIVLIPADLLADVTAAVEPVAVAVAAAQPAAATRPVPAPPPSLASRPVTEHTPGGLPVRSRSGRVAPARREAPATEGGDRSPEEVRSKITSYQAGIRRGRTETDDRHEDGPVVDGRPS